MNSKPMEVKKSRNHNPKLLAVVHKFEPTDITRIGSTCAYIQNLIEPQRFELGGNWEETLAAKVSAPYVLARLCSLFNGLQIKSSGQDAYKVTWETALKHKETGHVVTFYDYKGGISYGSNVYSKETPKAFVRDLKKLIKTLADDRCPHPYDGCVVGEIA